MAEAFSALHMWQSQIGIEYYSVVYFEHITKFDTLKRWASTKGGAHMRFIDTSAIHVFTRHVWAPPLAEVQRYSMSNLVMRSKYTTK